jgi:hypothetical protein
MKAIVENDDPKAASHDDPDDLQVSEPSLTSRDGIDLETRVDDLQRTFDELIKGNAGISDLIFDAAANRLACEIEILLWPDEKLSHFLEAADDPGPCTRSHPATAAARELARRTLSAHARIAEARVRAGLARR